MSVNWTICVYLCVSVAKKAFNICGSKSVALVNLGLQTGEFGMGLLGTLVTEVTVVGIICIVFLILMVVAGVRQVLKGD